jgi:hypothetical protein
LQQRNGSLPFLFSVVPFSLYTVYVYPYIYIETAAYIYIRKTELYIRISIYRIYLYGICLYVYSIYIYIPIFLCWFFKLKTEAHTIFLIRLPFVHRANGSLSFVRVLTKKQTKVIHLQTVNGLKEHVHLHIVTALDMLQVVEKLCLAGADTTASSTGETPLWIALGQCHRSMI